MEIKLAETLKELRKNRGNTQEELAAFLGVTVQAISKWERAEGLPDITFLPRIAGFYGVSVDTLLGVDRAAKEARIDEICREYEEIRRCPPHDDGTLVVENNIEAGIALIRNALKELPDCWFFMQLLASDLWYHAKSREGEEKSALLDETEGWCRKILADCTEDRWRHCANEILCLTLFDQGNRQQAVELAWSLPGAVGSNDHMLTQVLQGPELERQLHISIREFIRLAYLAVQKLKENQFSRDRLREQEFIRVQLDAIIREIYAE